MIALVEPAAIKGKAHGRHDLNGERMLLLRGKLAGNRQQRPRVLQRNRLADERGQAARQPLEHGLDLGAREPRAEFVDERIVGREIQRLTEEGCLVAHQAQNFLEVRREELDPTNHDTPFDLVRETLEGDKR